MSMGSILDRKEECIMAIIPEDFFKCVLALGRNLDSEWFATGFLCSKKIGNLEYHFIVTNKHVLENEKVLYIRLFNEKNKKYESIKLELQKSDGSKCYSYHPSQDVAVAMLRGGLLEEYGFKWNRYDIDEGMLSSEEYSKEGGSVGSRVFMIGFPMGLVDIEENIPICRGGYLARKEKTGYLLDIQNFPGNSGSPIISCPEIVKVDGTKAMNKIAVIGIVRSYIPYKKGLIDPQTNQLVEIRDENSGLARACTVEVIREVVNAELERNKVNVDESGQES